MQEKSHKHREDCKALNETILRIKISRQHSLTIPNSYLLNMMCRVSVSLREIQQRRIICRLSIVKKMMQQRKPYLGHRKAELVLLHHRLAEYLHLKSAILHLTITLTQRGPEEAPLPEYLNKKA